MQPEILLTLSAGSVAPLIAEKDPRCPTVFAVPQFVATDLQLRGLNLPASLLAGFGIPDIDRLRDEADRAHCPVLLLTEEAPIDFTDRGEQFAKSRDRLKRLALAANRLGCPSIAVRAVAADTEQAFELTVQGVKVALRDIDRYELNLLLSPHEGLTFEPTRLTDLIKKIGGFRIGSYPSFAHAAATGDVEQALRKLAPYAPAICASIRGFAKDGTHEGYSLEACVESVRSVGYGNTLALDFGGPDAGGEGEGGAEGGGKSAGKKPRKGARKPSIADIIEALDRGRQVLEQATMAEELDEDVELVEEEE